MHQLKISATIFSLFFQVLSSFKINHLTLHPLRTAPPPSLRQPWVTVTTTSLRCRLTLWPPCRSSTTRPAPVQHHQTSSLWEHWRRTGWVYWIQWQETVKLTLHQFCVLFSRDAEQTLQMSRGVSADLIGLSRIYCIGVYLNQNNKNYLYSTLKKKKIMKCFTLLNQEENISGQKPIKSGSWFNTVIK